MRINSNDAETRESLALLFIMKKDKIRTLREYETLRGLNPGIARKIKALSGMIQ